MTPSFPVDVSPKWVFVMIFSMLLIAILQHIHYVMCKFEPRFVFRVPYSLNDGNECGARFFSNYQRKTGLSSQDAGPLASFFVFIHSNFEIPSHLLLYDQSYLRLNRSYLNSIHYHERKRVYTARKTGSSASSCLRRCHGREGRISVATTAPPNIKQRLQSSTASSNGVCG